eukprot:762619-Hanusia_phi.AAC.1
MIARKGLASLSAKDSGAESAGSLLAAGGTSPVLAGPGTGPPGRGGRRTDSVAAFVVKLPLVVNSTCL